MGGERDGPIAALYETEAGYSQRDLREILVYYGFEFERHTRHGALHVSRELSKHPELRVRQNLARVLVPKGKELRRYVARDVKASVEALLAYREEDSGG